MLLPFTIGKTELIEVVRITDPARHLTSEGLVGDTVAIWERAQAHEVLAVIDSLPGGEMQRCFRSCTPS
ncbi:hypothetical protein ACWD6P_22320 [Streptomyces sp. NPDC002446]